MSNEESQKPDENACGVVGRSSVRNRVDMVLDQVGVSSLSVETRVKTISHRPSDDYASVEISVGPNGQSSRQASVDHASAFSPSTTRTFIGRLIRDSEEPSSVFLPSVANPFMDTLIRNSVESPAVFLPSATRPSPFESRFHLSLPHQATDRDDIDDDSNNNDDYRNAWYVQIPKIDLYFDKHNESAYALLISGRDINNIAFRDTCLRDAHAMKDVLSGPKGIIAPNNISLITPDTNRTEKEIENIYSHLIMKRPRKLFFYFSGHSLSTSTGQPRMNVSAWQGNALDVSRVKRFIGNLLPRCLEVFVILDCCSAAEHLLLPMVPADAYMAANRSHIQWCSSKRGGKSYLYAGSNSVFTLCVISAMTYANECPNKDGNCPLCSKLRSLISHSGQVGLTLTHLMDYVQNHLKLSRHHFSFIDLPQIMANPVARA